MTRICIFGAGAIGGYVGAALHEAGADVSLVARGPHLAAIREDANAFFFPGASPGSSQDVLIQREAETREVSLIVPADD